MQTREQEYANTIFEQVTSFKQAKLQEHGSEDKAKLEIKQYGSMAHQLPVLVRTAGLAQALTFIEARDNKMHKELLDHLAKVVGKPAGKELAEAARKENLPAYMRLTQQVMAALVWYKRFAQSVLGVKSGDGVTDKPNEDGRSDQEGGM